jgi:D-glycero-alpha-D-manno-heptose-7-phosphate kinase
VLIRAKAPLRVSFAGGGTDVPPFPSQEGGCVLSTTINMHTYGSLRVRSDSRILIDSADFEMLVDCDAETLHYDGKLDLAKAAIRKFTPGDAGFSMYLESDAPPGSGLGSSSSMVVTMVGLLKEHRSLPMTDYEVAHAAYSIERHDLGIKGGLQDQYAAAFGGFNFIEFQGDRVVVNPLRVSRQSQNELEHNLLLCYTGATRLSAGIIEDQTARYESSQEQTLAGLRKQKELALRLKDALLLHRFNDFGEMLHEAWTFKKKISPKISTPFIDEIYAEALKQGALGGKIMGAGGGGYMILYCPYELKRRVATALKRMGAVPTAFAFTEKGLETWRASSEGERREPEPTRQSDVLQKVV